MSRMKDKMIDRMNKDKDRITGANMNFYGPMRLPETKKKKARKKRTK